MKTKLGKTIKANFALVAILLSSTGVLIGNTSTPSYARERGCEAIYTIDGGSTGSIYIKDVGGFLRNKKKLCLEAAENYAKNTLRVEDFKGIDVDKTKQNICNQAGEGGIVVDISTDVDGKVNSRNGKVRSNLNVGC